MTSIKDGQKTQAAGGFTVQGRNEPKILNKLSVQPGYKEEKCVLFPLTKVKHTLSPTASVQPINQRATVHTGDIL